MVTVASDNVSTETRRSTSRRGGHDGHRNRPILTLRIRIPHDIHDVDFSFDDTIILAEKKIALFFFVFSPIGTDTNDTKSTTLIRYLIQLIGEAMVPERDQRMQISAPRYAKEAANFSPISSQQPLMFDFSVANRLIQAL